MQYCFSCGKEISPDEKFCTDCGATIADAKTSAKTCGPIVDGVVHKCPQCGEILKAFQSYCPSCKHEIRGTEASRVTVRLFQKLENVVDIRKKMGIIKTFPIPNTKEDIFSLMTLACANFDAHAYVLNLDIEDESDAWLSLVERCYHQASISLKNDPDFGEIEQMYHNVISRKNELLQEENTRVKKNRFFKKYFIFVLAGAAILVAIMAFMIGNHYLDSDYTQIGISSETLMDYDVKTAEEYFLAKGFCNITLKEIDWTGDQIPGQILWISVSGNKTYDSNTRFDKNSQVVVAYSGNPAVLAIGYDVGSMIGKDIAEVKALFTTMGFCNIREIIKPWNANIEPSIVLAVSINGNNSFTEESTYAQNAQVTITYSGEPAEICIGSSSADFIGRNAESTKQELLTMGFVSVTLIKSDWNSNYDVGAVVDISIDSHANFSGMDIFTQKSAVTIVYNGEPAEICIGSSSADFIGRNAESTKQELLTMGFVSVTLIKSNWNSNYDVGAVVDISIDSHANFSGTDIFTQKSTVTIVYNGEPAEICIGCSSEDFIDSNAEEMARMLASLGFVNIQMVETHWNLLHKAGAIRNITIDGVGDFSESTVFSQDAEIIIEYYG